jgi:hypothetical protein
MRNCVTLKFQISLVGISITYRHRFFAFAASRLRVRQRQPSSHAKHPESSDLLGLKIFHAKKKKQTQPAEITRKSLPRVIKKGKTMVTL